MPSDKVQHKPQRGSLVGIDIMVFAIFYNVPRGVQRWSPINIARKEKNRGKPEQKANLMAYNGILGYSSPLYYSRLLFYSSLLGYSSSFNLGHPESIPREKKQTKGNKNNERHLARKSNWSPSVPSW